MSHFVDLSNRGKKSNDLKKNKRHISKWQLIYITLLIISFFLFVTSLLFFTFIQTEIWIVNYDISSLEDYQNMLERKIRSLKLEKAILKRPERIRRVAQEQLLLKYPSKIYIFEP